MMKRLVSILFAVFMATVMPTGVFAQEHFEESKGGLLSKHLYSSTSSFSRGSDTKSWSGGIGQGGWASVHPNINIGFSADYTLVSSSADSYAFGFGIDLLAHFLPDNNADPFVQIGFGHATSQLLLTETDTFAVGVVSGVEIRVSDMVSILPSIGYTYGKYDSVITDGFNLARIDGSVGVISPDFDVAIRLGRDSRIWLSPGVSYSLEVHGDGQDVFTFSLSMSVEL